MVNDKDKQAVQDIARKYGVSRVLLFGSSLAENNDSRDIDIAVEGISDADYFAFYGDLLFALSKPVDVVDLSVKSSFIELIKKEGVELDA